MRLIEDLRMTEASVNNFGFFLQAPDIREYFKADRLHPDNL